MGNLSTYFKPVDWLVVFGYLALTTVIGHMMRGKQASIKDFFLGGRSLPWPAVSGSIIATEISGVTFIGVPGMLMAMNGNFTYLQWAIGSIFARIIVGMVFVRVFYEREIFSPYDYMGYRIGEGVKKLATILFTIGSILAQSVRVMVAALPLKVVTPLPFEWCIVVIGVFAVGWTLMGGMRTVIWTDVMQFGLFVVGGLVALFWLVGSFDNGWGTFFDVANSVKTASGGGKLEMFNFSLDPSIEFTFWVAIFAAPFLNLNAFGVDQLNAQRMFCCKDARDARKAIIFSSVGQLVTLLMLAVGAALFVHYHLNPPTNPDIVAAMDWKDGAPGQADNVFPAWIVTTLPLGLRGLILAGIFAAAISSLDSILAALSQTTLSMFYPTGSKKAEDAGDSLVVKSRILVVTWGIILTAFTFILFEIKERSGDTILPLAFSMTAYTVGPLLGMFLVALFARKRGSILGLSIGAVISLILVALCTTHVWILFEDNAIREALARLPSFNSEVLEDGTVKLIPKLAFAWMWPITTIITIGFGVLFPRKVSESEVS